MRHYPTVPFEHWDRAQEMRKKPTPAERALWRAVRSGVLDATFRRQHPIGPYIVDLICLPKKLVIEVDGGGHVEPDQIQYDKARNQYLTERGFRVRRYFNHDVLRNLESVLKDIAEALKE
ncbi:MAG: endonuclease domain-containing protein [bacterium]